jgi:class 3 adenylate cyclase/tetratricopeptide (TPR) repeat protein
MKCPECQFDNREGVNFCEKCGATLELNCPNCKASIPPDRKFCGICGRNLTDFSEITSIDYSEPQSYTPKFLADKILTTRSSIEGERKLVTVLFADVADFTSIAEKLDPEEVHQIMDGCFKILMDEIHRYEGTINQFTGDGVMALFGAPVAHENHPQRACYSALSIQKAIGDYSVKVKKDFSIEFMMRVGINSGPVVVGSIGDDLRMDYTAVGDTTNLANRIENEARPGSILVSKNTHKIARDFFEFKPIGKVEVKGREEPQEAYELLRTGEVETRFKASVAKGLTKFVGRKKSMPALIEVYDRAIAGSGQIVGVVGEAGVGKSRLLLEFVNQLPTGNVTYLEGRCLHYGESIIYMPFLKILKSYFDIKEEDREFIINKKIKEKTLALDEKLEHIIPPFLGLLSLKVDDQNYLALKPTQKREKTFEAMRDLFIRASQEKPLILVVEDLHWIDKTSEQFLDYLIGWIANTQILLIILYRPEYTHHWGSKSYYTKIGLTQLGTASSSKLIQTILEEGEIVPELEQLILNRSSGNPLFMEELTYSLLENGIIQKKDRKYLLNKKTSDVQVPDSIQDIIAARMDRLEENLKRTMQVASVIGRDFAFRVLQTITGMREELKSYLLNLQGLEFIYEKSLFPELEYIFKHALTQEVAYNSLLLNRRKEIHENIGKAIEELYAERLEEFYEVLAYHFYNSNNHEKGAEYSTLSSKKAQKGGAITNAIEYSKWIVSCYEKLPESDEMTRKIVDARTRLAKYYQNLSYHSDAKNAVEPIVELAEKINYHEKLPSIYSVLGAYDYLVLENFKSAEAHLKKATVLAEKENDLISLYIANYNLGSVFLHNCEFDEGHKCFDICLKLSELGENPTGIVFAKAIMSLNFNIQGKSLIGFKLSEEAVKKAEEKDDPFIKSASLSIHGVSCYYKGLFNDAEDYLLNATSACMKTKNAVWGILSTLFLADFYCLFGKYEKARENVLKSISFAEDANSFPTFRALNVLYSFLLRALNNDRSFSLKVLFQNYKNIKINYLKGLASKIVGEILLNLKEENLTESGNWIKKSIQLNNKYGIMFHRAQAHALYAEFFKRKNDLKKAKYHLSNSIDIFTECGADGWVEKYEMELEALV